jgi:hypothetical protein
MKKLPIFLIGLFALSSCSNLKDMAYNDPVYFTQDDIRAERMGELATLRAGYAGNYSDNRNQTSGNDDYSSDYYDPNFIDSQQRNFDDLSVDNFANRQRMQNNNFGFGAPGCFDCVGSPRFNMMMGVGMGNYWNRGVYSRFGMHHGMGMGMGMGMGWGDPFMRNSLMWGSPGMMAWYRPMWAGGWGSPFYDPFYDPWMMGGGMMMNPWMNPWGNPMMMHPMAMGHMWGPGWGIGGPFIGSGFDGRRTHYGSRNQGVYTPSRTGRSTDNPRARTGAPAGSERQAAPSRSRGNDYYRAPSNARQRSTAAPARQMQRQAPSRGFSPQRATPQRTAPNRNMSQPRYSAPQRSAPQRAMPQRTAPSRSTPSRSFSSPSPSRGGGGGFSPSRGGGGGRR